MDRGLVSVDKWGKGSQAYFLTHLHADHTAGLSSRWSRGPLFCSAVSARLLPTRFPGFDLSLLTVLEIGSTRPLSLTSPTTGSEVRLLVTTIDARHCPGAVMYLFRGEFGCVLHTGDFRWEPMCEGAQLVKQMLLDALRGDKVDVLYLDNTYCHPSYAFPSRKVAAQQVVDIISLYPDHDVIIGLDSLGKEDLLHHISCTLNTKVWVWPERLQTMHLLGFDDIFTTMTRLTRIRAVPRYCLGFGNLEALNTIHPTIGIMPSGLPWGVKPFGKSDDSLHLLEKRYKSKVCAESDIHSDRNQNCNPRRYHKYAYSVPYSEHSCFSEIMEFIKILEPSNVIGIVSSSFCNISPRHYLGHSCGASRKSDKLSENVNGAAKKVEANKRQTVMERGKCRRLQTNGKRKTKASSLSVQRNWVCVRRRLKIGARIAESENSCDSN